MWWRITATAQPGVLPPTANGSLWTGGHLAPGALFRAKEHQHPQTELEDQPHQWVFLSSGMPLKEERFLATWRVDGGGGSGVAANQSMRLRNEARVELPLSSVSWVSCRFRAARGGRGHTGWRGTMGYRFRVVAGRWESPVPAKAVAAFVPHCATAVHIGGAVERRCCIDLTEWPG